MLPRLVVASVGLVLVLTACAGDRASSPPAAETPTVEVPGETADDRIALADLPMGPLPQLDVLIGSTLIHEGAEIELQLPEGQFAASAVGRFGGRPIVETFVGGSNQFVTVADDGTTEPLGEPFESYNYRSRLVPESGHLLTFYSDRGTGGLFITVLDAATGEQLAASSPDGVPPASALVPADRVVTDVLTGVRQPRPGLLAVSPDGSLAVTTGRDRDFPAVLTVGPIGGDGRTLRFRGEAGHVAFESNDAFLVTIAERENSSQPRVDVVVRCTIDGACERTTDPSRNVTIAGADGVHFGTD